MNKIYLVIAGAFFILLVIITLLLSLGKKSTNTTKTGLPLPTGVSTQGSVNLQNNQQQQSNQQINPQVEQRINPSSSVFEPINNDSQNINGLPFDISKISPVETEDLKVQYNANLNQIVVEKKTLQAETKFTEWANKKNYSLLVNNPNTVKFIRPGQDPEFDPLISFLNIFMNMGQGTQLSISPTDFPQSSNNNLIQPTNKPLPNPGQLQSKVYYAQCGDQGNLPLPNGCTMCNAGCGAASAAMIASSYVDKKYDLKTVVDLYKKNNYLLGCDGSRYSDARSLLQGLGLKTTDYITFNSEKSETVIPQLKKYLNEGWTFFTLANFCESGCGHYFWITDIDSQGNIWAYDPAYGRYQIPNNENSRYPYPSYRLAFGVKR